MVAPVVRNVSHGERPDRTRRQDRLPRGGGSLQGPKYFKIIFCLFLVNTFHNIT